MFCSTIYKIAHTYIYSNWQGEVCRRLCPARVCLVWLNFCLQLWLFIEIHFCVISLWRKGVHSKIVLLSYFTCIYIYIFYWGRQIWWPVWQWYLHLDPVFEEGWFVQLDWFFKWYSFSPLGILFSIENLPLCTGFMWMLNRQTKLVHETLELCIKTSN